MMFGHSATEEGVIMFGDRATKEDVLLLEEAKICLCFGSRRWEWETGVTSLSDLALYLLLFDHILTRGKMPIKIRSGLCASWFP